MIGQTLDRHRIDESSARFRRKEARRYRTGAQIAAVVLVLMLPVHARDAQLCRQWATATRIGELSPRLRESSGIAASREYPDRLYHVNDSGDAGRFYVSRLDGSELRQVTVAGFRARDTEALSVGPCPGVERRSCIYVADIGDNRRRRTTIEVAAIEERNDFAATVTPTARVSFNYPDGAHDAESMAIHPDGRIFILTKEHPARLYTARLGGLQQTLSPVTSLDIGTPPTDMAISDDGSRLLVLTYKEAVEFAMDFTERRRIAIRPLPQQESVTYLPGSRSFAFTTERVMLLPQPIMMMECVSPRARLSPPL